MTCPPVSPPSRVDAGIALLAVLMALTLLLLLALPFAVSMSRGADVATRAIEARQVELLSASARDLLLTQAALGHPTYDETPGADDRSEYPDGVPATFPALQQEGRARFGGEVVDLQRFASLDAITPLLLENLIGTAAHLTKDLLPADDTLQLDEAGDLPESGWLWVDHEVLRYGEKQGNTLLQLERGQLLERGFLPPKDHTVAATAPVHDWRCVLASAWSFDGRTQGARTGRVPLAAPGELAEIDRAGQGAFTLLELDRFARALAEHSDVVNAPVWGRPERVFQALVPGQDPPMRTLVVKSALHVGAGSTVRLRNLATGAVEFNLVMSTRTPRNKQPELLLPSIFELELLYPVAQDFPAIDTVVEPLVPAPVNVNTADPGLIAALLTGCRRGIDVRVHEGAAAQRSAPPQPISSAEARALADEFAALRGEAPFRGWQDLAERVWKPRLQDAGQEQKLRLLYLYRALLTGRDSVVEMGTAPIAFASGPIVGYRAAATLQRSVVASAIAARHERTGVAVAMPGLLLTAPWRTQEELEEAFRLDCRAPYWLTGPINTGSVGSGEAGNDPISRYLAHVVAMAFPDAGLGAPRFPSREATDATLMPGPVSIAPGQWTDGSERRGHEAFATSIDPRGRDLDREGPFLVANTGPRDANAPPAPSRTHELQFPFTVANAKGGAGRFALSAWFELDSLRDGALFDYSDGDVDRNRMALLVRNGQLVFEVVDEAGIDPDPSQSPAGVERTASAWQLPLAELALPPDTPVHLAVAAYGNRPSDLSFAVDGVVRGKPRYRTSLQSPVAGYDPSRSLPGPPGQNSNDPRYLLLQCEDLAGWPARGVVRIGLELFEYNDINGNALLCAFLDSCGGRGARQLGREHRPEIPVDQNGKPTIDIDQITASGVNLDQFPEHPVGAEVELYGYSLEPQADRLVYPGETSIDGSIGAFAVARAWLSNGRPVVLQLGNATLQLGTGLDATWTGDIELADPPTAVPATLPPAAPQPAITDAFPASGGYALLVQRRVRGTPSVAGQVGGTATMIGGVEPVRYQSRQGNKLIGVQRAVGLPSAGRIDAEWYDGTARNFVADWNDNLTVGTPPKKLDEAPTYLLNIVPISLSLQSASQLPDPSVTGAVEWAQLRPRGDAVDTEWVRYDGVMEGRMLVRGNRSRWEQLRYALTTQTAVTDLPVGPLGGSANDVTPTTPWGTVTPTSGYIGYVPRLEGDFPQILAARQALGFRGDPFTGTSSHPHSNSQVLPCHRFEFRWGNHGALTGRPGRHDRVALVGGSGASGTQRPPVEWHTVHWSARMYSGDLAPGRPQPVEEPVGPDAFQLAAFQAPVAIVATGRARGSAVVDARTVDRLVKFPGGELPAAACEHVVCGGAQRAGLQSGFVDEIDAVEQIAEDLVVDESFADTAREFTVVASAAVRPDGLLFLGNDLSAAWPAGGGLLQVDSEILAYTERRSAPSPLNPGSTLATITIARNGRGLLNTEPRGHDRGARVRFLSHRPAAILASAVSPRGNTLPLQALGALGRQFGTVLLNRSELLHYCWIRSDGTTATLEMPRSFPPGQDGDSTGARGLLRGRFGTAPQSAGAGEPVIAMPFRYWDRYVPRNDDPEQAYFQFTTREAPVYFRTLRWTEEVPDSNVEVVCLVRADERAPWTDDPARGWLRRLVRPAGSALPLPLDLQATELEVRFCTEYKPGCVDLATFRAHGWKTAPRIRAVELEYEGEGRILHERVTAR